MAAIADPVSSSAPRPTPVPTWRELNPDGEFVRRHIGPGDGEIARMLEVCGLDTLEQLANAAVPADIRLQSALDLPTAGTEASVLADLRQLAGENQPWRTYIGQGYYGTRVPPVIQRNVLENPGWYTQYTPYQAEIAQGRLEALLNFQTLVCDLTGMEVANASLLDDATAAAEALTLCLGQKAREKRDRFLVSSRVFAQTRAVIETRAHALDVEIEFGDENQFTPDHRTAGILLQYPDDQGAVTDLRPIVERAHAAGAMVVVASDLLALCLLQPPAAFGADVVVGSAQRLGVPMGYGGPHAAFFATRDAFKRQLPGRLVGVSRDALGRPALRLALQTREQHIRRDKATSNICTAQALLANMASLYAVWHGPEGLTRIAWRIHRYTDALARIAEQAGWRVLNESRFDTLTLAAGTGQADALHQAAARHRINLRRINAEHIGISLDETVTEKDFRDLALLFGETIPEDLEGWIRETPESLPVGLRRTDAFLQDAVFHRYRSETEMLRYLKRLESRDLSLAQSMIPLGSCTMKLNATAEMYPVTWPEFAHLHPFAPLEQTGGYQRLFADLESWLASITGFAAVSLQPNAGSQGEYAGLLVIRRYHESRGEDRRRVCLIPVSAHGTNPASAVMAGMKVVPVQCDEQGNINQADLQAKAEAHRETLAALMITYPSTHGVFETTVRDLCRIVHDNGGQVYLDGANLNAQVGLCRPGDYGADVCHLNLHKTFCIPHGGGGPGMGPIAVAPHLAPHLPGHPAWKTADHPAAVGPVAAAPWGSAAILPITWVYIALMGADGLTRATQVAILNANYIARKLEPFFPVLFKGANGLVAHECILDLRPYKSVTVEDVAKRLMDYGFHAPTISWPVPGTMMVEPTESENQAELDRFCEAMIAIHGEIQEIENGVMDPQDNPLKNAPHTTEGVTAADWSHPYSREQAAFPLPWVRERKFWPAVARIDNVYGDRHPICTCAGMEEYQEG